MRNSLWPHQSYSERSGCDEVGTGYGWTEAAADNSREENRFEIAVNSMTGMTKSVIKPRLKHAGRIQV